MGTCPICNGSCTDETKKVREGAVIDDIPMPILDKCSLEEIQQLTDEIDGTGACLVLAPFLGRVYVYELDWKIVNIAMNMQGLVDKYEEDKF